MAGRPILQELGGTQHAHPGEEFVSKHLDVALAIHRHLWRKEVKGALSSNAAETTPDHHTGGMFYVENNVPLLAAVDTGRTVDTLGPGIYKLESRLVRKHNSLPVLLCPVEVFLAKRKPLLDHGGWLGVVSWR